MRKNLLKLGLGISLSFVLLAFPSIVKSDCSVGQQCSAEVEITCSLSGSNDCEKEDCKYIRCGNLTFKTSSCPNCGPGNPIIE